MGLEYLEGFEDAATAQTLAREIGTLAAKRPQTRLMHLCGSHEQAINENTLRQLLPDSVEIVPGPGCPVCVCPVEDIDLAVTLAREPGVTLLTFGDMIRVPGTVESLAQARKEGASVQVIYSPLDAIAKAKEAPEQQFVFFSVGFETTVAGVAGLAAAKLPGNLTFLMANRYMPPVLRLLMEIHDQSIQGFLLPGHAAIITGLEPYRFMETEYKLPCAVAGFEPVDVLYGILGLMRQIDQGQAKVENLFKRLAKDEGNQAAWGLINRVFELGPGIWRGIDKIPGSAFRLKADYAHLDALKRFAARPAYAPRAHPPGCQCHRIMLGEKRPTDCAHFKKGCTPNNPLGPCMVSVEGTCYSWFRFSGL
ncbi:MAG: hydrogenase formation protein HypD [bacterium]|nr:hydrogenase formation protein HypD [bacterium]